MQTTRSHSLQPNNFNQLKIVERNQTMHLPKRPTSFKSGKPCLKCQKCRELQRRVRAIDNAYKDMRISLLTTLTSKHTSDSSRSKTLQDEVDQLRITLDMIIRSQLFELHEYGIPIKCEK